MAFMKTHFVVSCLIQAASRSSSFVFVFMNGKGIWSPFILRARLVITMREVAIYRGAGVLSP